MTEQSAKSISLDDLLKSSKQQFDNIFAAQMTETGLVDVSHRPPTQADLASASLQAATASDATAMLNQRFGDRWSSEVVEHKNERGTVTVLCKLVVDGVSKMQFGSARANGDAGAALRRATDDALVNCAAQFGDISTPSAEEVLTRGNGGAALAAPTAAPSAEAAPRESGALDPITLDLIENALRNARHEMDAVLFRSAMSPVIREQHDEFPMITDHKGRMIVGQFGSYVSEMLADQNFDLAPGDVILQSDPYKCGGAISHINDWMVLVPIFVDGELIGFSSMFGHMMDVGGSVPGSMPTSVTSIFAEGIKIPPIKIYERGEINKAALDILMNNTRTPEMNYSDLMAIVAGSRAGERRVIEICERFGKETYKQACEALLDRTNRAMRQLIVQNLPEEPQSFEDYVDDDGCGNGPFKMKLTVWREGDQDVSRDVGDDDVERRQRRSRVGHGALPNGGPAGQVVDRQVLQRRLDGVRLDVQCGDRAGAQFERRESQDSRSTAQVVHRRGRRQGNAVEQFQSWAQAMIGKF